MSTQRLPPPPEAEKRWHWPIRIVVIVCGVAFLTLITVWWIKSSSPDVCQFPDDLAGSVEATPAVAGQTTALDPKVLISALEWDNPTAPVGSKEVQEIFKVDTANPDQVEFLADGAAPTISPDRSQIMYLKRDGGKRVPWLMDANGDNSRPFESYEPCASYTRPAWSQTGKFVSLLCADTGGKEINAVYVFTNDGEFYRNLHTSGTPDPLSSPTWVGDNALIFGQRASDDNQSSLWIFPSIAQGTQAVQLTFGDDGSADTNPDWSAERGALLFLRKEPNAATGAIWFCEPGGDARQWATEDWFTAPTWSPDGEGLAFLMRTDENAASQLAWAPSATEDPESWIRLPDAPVVVGDLLPLDEQGRELDPAGALRLPPAWGSR